MADDQVFGMGDDPLAEPTWPPLTDDEIARAVATTWGGSALAAIEWRGARPLSSTVGVRSDGGERFVVKRMPLRLRDEVALSEEHRFMAHLRERGVPVPEVLVAVGDRVTGRPGRGSGASTDRGRSSGGVGEFVYEVHRAGIGEDRYRADFSWSPYRDREDAASAGAMLGRLHTAAAGFDTPARPSRPLLASMHGDVVRAFERAIAKRPSVDRFLSGRDWRAEVPEFQADFSGIAPQWTHGDWHATNVLWDDHEVTSVIDFGLADRTTAVFDLATAIERTTIDWVSLRDGGPAHVRTDQIAALIEGYRSARPLSAAEQNLLPDLLPLVHIGYELSEIDYFLTIAHDPRNAEIAYRDWLLGHLHWYGTAEGRELRDTIRDLVH
ncbi:phosphotransferase enzyme family protein [Nocardia alba]|uniref:Ser/Thr protein kinase RdoA (MazF antagonist) n=1 Tax=Nocardia alba TaxID=225051 RepID=A0A4R1FG50_9NOCA|nr:phosphotransferase [Nocardia alba]TCJ93767.1 Ser/Thr protein kinase RdoA (MazF antagonist) [Nocardia alba]